MNLKPFIKWAGGKTQLLSEIEKRMPKKFKNYFEPFLGGGAVFSLVVQKYSDQKKYYLNDFSQELINTYQCIKKDYNQLINLLDEHMAKHVLNPKDYYYFIRELDRSESWNSINNFEKASRFIYLNKLCFNGVYRVNSKGYFNVPWNQKNNVNVYDKSNLEFWNQVLNFDVELTSGDFEKSLQFAKKGDFIFLDPPYDLLNKNTFDSYTKEKFGKEGQIRLSQIAHKLRDKGCYVMLTNHNTELINVLYSDFNINIINVKRNINSVASDRKGIETIICSYEV